MKNEDLGSWPNSLLEMDTSDHLRGLGRGAPILFGMFDSLAPVVTDDNTEASGTLQTGAPNRHVELPVAGECKRSVTTEDNQVLHMDEKGHCYIPSSQRKLENRPGFGRGRGTASIAGYRVTEPGRRLQQEGGALINGSIARQVEAPVFIRTEDMNRNEFLAAAAAGIVTVAADEDLVVNSVKTCFLEALRNHRVVIVEGFTGCGKTTQIPQFILDNCKDSRIVVTQPRRIAAISVAERVCKMRGWQLGETVGYQVGMDRSHTDATRLIYMTTGVLLQVLINRKSLKEFQYIIIDEVHERDLDTDLLLLVVKKLMMEAPDTNIKIILMSATLEAQKFQKYFSVGYSEICQPCAAVIKVPDAPIFTIAEAFVEDLKVSSGKPDISSSGYQRAVDTIMNLDEIENHSNVRGAVLVFLPGWLEIETLYKYLFDYVQNLKTDENSADTLKWHILPLHSTITSEEQQKVFHPPPPGMRKIILATNIAESSITVPDIRYVIDFCLTKSLGCDPTTNYTCLRLEWASKNQCTQRRGRCGRVADGIVYRMVPKLFYEKLLQEAPPEMSKSSLENVVLHVKTLGLGTPKELLELAVDPPPLSKIRRAVQNLKEVGALTLDVVVKMDGVKYISRDDCDGDLTYMGKIMASLPIDIRLGRLILIGHLFGLTEEAVIIAAGLSTKSPFSCPFFKKIEADMSKLKWAKESCSDCIALVNAYRTWRGKFAAQDLARNTGRSELEWAKENLIQKNVIREIHNMVDEISRRLDKKGITIPVAESTELDDEKRLLLKVAIAGAFYPNYFTRRVNGNPVDYWKIIDKELNGKDPFSTVVYCGFPHNVQPEAYTSDILAHFEESEPYPIVTYVEPRSNKFFLSFDSGGPKVGLISHGVYRAVKMRQQRMSISFLTKPTYDYELLQSRCTDIQTVTLKDFRTQLEMRFRATSRASWQQEIVIDGSSVNSVCLDQNIDNPVEQLLIAGIVSIMEKSGNLMARQTTLMPPIPGLPTLLTMMFCPTLEWRCDEKFTRYTGLVAGLGYEKSRDGVAAPVYQDHDVEIINEVEITDEDIREVNGIRRYMNTILQTDRPECIGNCQALLRDLIVKFLLKKRTMLTEDKIEWPKGEHKWNCYPPHIEAKVLKEGGDGGSPGIPLVFQPHHKLNLKSKPS